MYTDEQITKSQFEAQFGDTPSEAVEFAKIRVGLKNLDDAIMNLSSHSKVNRNYGDKAFILNAMHRKDYETVREISNYFYEASGIYQRMCKYLALLYRYDWFVTPFQEKKTGGSKEPTAASGNKMLADFSKVLKYLDNSDIKRLFGNIALEVVKNGSYYGCIIDFNDKFSIQQLPSAYCRSRFTRGVDPVIELDMRFFDAYFPNVQYRLKVLSMFPKEIQKAYIQYKEGKLVGDYPGDKRGWAMLDPDTTIKFNLNNGDFPPLAGVIPSIIDLDSAQELDRKKTMQQLLKIIIQKLPLDKNGDLIFDVDEARDIHNNAVKMLGRAVGVDVLTTFADVEVANMQDRNSTTTLDDLQKVERTVYNNSGFSQNLFNTDGNIALEKSIANDEATMRDLVLQFENLLNRVVKKFNKSNYTFNVDILETTIYNYKEIAKMYKEHTQIGYSKMLPQVALGHSQSTILATAHFENDVLKLADIMIPPSMSSTMSGKNGGTDNKSNTNKNQNTSQSNSSAKVSTETKAAGRPEKADGEKSAKTIQNKESMS